MIIDSFSSFIWVAGCKLFTKWDLKLMRKEKIEKLYKERATLIRTPK